MELADAERNRLASRSLSDNKGPFEYLHNKPAGDAKTTSQSEDNSSMGLSSRSTSELTSRAVTFEKGTSVIAIPASEGKNAADSQSQILASSVPAYDKPKEANSSHLFSFSSKAADNSPSFPSGSTERAESAEISSRLVVLYDMHRSQVFAIVCHLNIFNACSAWPIIRYQLALKSELLIQRQDFI